MTQGASRSGRSAGASAPAAAITSDLDTLLPDLLRGAGAPWCTVAVRCGPSIVRWTWRAEPADVPGVAEEIAPDTVVRWASLAKPLTALAVLRLARIGRIGLDDPAPAHSPSFQPTPSQLAGHDPRAITLRRLLTHTSGMGVLRYPAMAWGKARPSAASLLAEVDGPRAWSLRHAPGEGLTYGSAAYVWLQSIVEDVSGVRFEHAVRNLVLDPLGLGRVAVLGDGPSPGRIAWGLDDAGATVTPRRSAAPGATGLFSSPEDVSRLFGGLVGVCPSLQGLIGEDLFRGILIDQTPGMGESWGLGWRLQSSEDGPVFRHAGWPDGILAYVEGLPRLGLLTCLAVGRSGARRAMVRIADIARWHARAGAQGTTSCATGGDGHA